MNGHQNTRVHRKNSRRARAGTIVECGRGGLDHLIGGSAAPSEIGINTEREYANWGGEFMDDAVRFGEKPFPVRNDSTWKIEEEWAVADFQAKNLSRHDDWSKKWPPSFA